MSRPDAHPAILPRPSALAILAALGALAVACAHVPVSPPSPIADDHLARGLEALARDDLDRAEAELTLALEHEPSMPEAENGLGLVALARGDLVSAGLRFERAVAIDDDFAEGHGNLGALSMVEGEPGAALPHLRAALDIDPGYPGARRNLARALAALGRLEEARSQYLLLTSAAPEDPDAWADLAAVELALGHRAAAGRAADAALFLLPSCREARRVRASLLRDGGALDEALAAYDDLLDEAPSDPLVLVDRAVTLLLLGRADEARQAADRAVGLAPGLPAAHLALGAAMAQAGDDGGAIACFVRAEELAASAGGRSPVALYLRAQALARLGRRDEAAAAYRALIELARGDAGLATLAARAEGDLAALPATRP